MDVVNEKPDRESHSSYANRSIKNAQEELEVIRERIAERIRELEEELTDATNAIQSIDCALEEGIRLAEVATPKVKEPERMDHKF